MKLSKLKPICGIYKITNLKNGRVYIGQSVNVMSRWAKHVDDLVNCKHSNSKLLADFKEHGLAAFQVEIIEKCKKRMDLLLKREEFYIAQFHQQGCQLYNRIQRAHEIVREQSVEKWMVGWKPIDKANAKPKWSGISFGSFSEASRAAAMLNMADPESHYFATTSMEQ